MSNGDVQQIIERLVRIETQNEQSLGYHKDTNAHLEKLNNQVDGHAKKIVEQGTDLRWLKRFFWLIAAPLMTVLVSSILYLVIND